MPPPPRPLNPKRRLRAPEDIDRDRCVALARRARNSLFHSGASFPDALLWFHVFPLVTRIVERLADGAQD